MNTVSVRIRKAVALAAAIILFTAGGTPAFAGDREGSSSPSCFGEGVEGGQGEGGQGEGGQGEGGQGEGGQGEGGQGEGGQGEGDQQDNSALVRQYSERVKAALDEMESHARAMVDAANSGDRKKYDKESVAYDNAEKLVSEAIDSSGSLPSSEVMPIVDKAYNRLDQIGKIRDKAETALANSLGGAMDENGKLYKLAKVKASVVEVYKGTDAYSTSVAALGPSFNDKENQIVYKISLKVGTKPVHLIGGLTKSVTIGIPGDRIGRSPVNAYYIWDGDDGNHGAPVAEKRGYFDKSTWCLTVKVSKSETYYVVTGKPASKLSVFPDDIVATRGKKENLTVQDLREMVSVTRLEEGSEKKAMALEAVKPEGKSTAVFEIEMPEDVTLVPEAEVIADLTCPEAADKTVEIFRITDGIAVWVASTATDNEGNMQFATSSFGVFVLTWRDEAQEETFRTVTPTDTESYDDPAPVWPWVAGTAAAVVIIIGGELMITSFFKKKA